MTVLFLDTVHPVLEQRLAAAGHACVHAYTQTGPALAPMLARAEGLVIRSRIPVDEALLAQAPGLKFIARAGSGMENIDTAACRKRGILLFNSPEGNRTAVAEHAVGMLLALLNRLKKADLEVRSGIRLRAENRGTELEGKTIGIIGLGQMGSAFAERLRGFGCRILGYDKYRHRAEMPGVIECSFYDICREADIVSFHVPQAPDTLRYFDARFVARMAKPFYLINTARGSVVCSQTLLSGLQSGKILGACLDVLENEAPSFEALHSGSEDPVWAALSASEKVLFSPHIAGWTHESHFKLSDVLADKILGGFS